MEVFIEEWKKISVEIRNFCGNSLLNYFIKCIQFLMHFVDKWWRKVLKIKAGRKDVC